MNGAKLEQSKAIEFMFAGNATFTFLSVPTKNRYTYKMQRGVKSSHIIFVSLLVGSNNEKDYQTFATISTKNGVPEFNTFPYKNMPLESPAKRAFKKVLFFLLTEQELDWLEIWHEGTCCRCGRKLTVPESIESGIGPECATKFVSVYA